MSKKILMITGSPRRFSNSTAMAQWAAAGAKSSDAEVKIVSVSALEFKLPGCSGCCECQKSEEFKCVLADGLAELVQSIPEYDVVVLASPVYFFTFPAQVKMVIDRFMCLCKGAKNMLSRTKFVLIAAAGGDEKTSGVASMYEVIRNLAGFVGAPEPEFFFKGGLSGDSRELEHHPDFITKVYEFGKKLAL